MCHYYCCSLELEDATVVHRQAHHHHHHHYHGAAAFAAAVCPTGAMILLPG